MDLFVHVCLYRKLRPIELVVSKAKCSDDDVDTVLEML